MGITSLKICFPSGAKGKKVKICRAQKKPGQQEHFPQLSLCIRNTTEETGRSVATKMKFSTVICNLKCQEVTEVFCYFCLWKDIRQNLSGSIIKKNSKNKIQFGHCLRKVQVKLAFCHSSIVKLMAGFTYKLYAVYVQKFDDKRNPGHYCVRWTSNCLK